MSDPTPSPDQVLAQRAIQWADNLTFAHGLDAGVVRQLARRLVEVAERGVSADEHACRGCGESVPQPERGRRRWCSEKCRRRFRD